MRVTRKAAVWTLNSLALTLLALSAYLAYPALHARYLLHEFATLQLGHSTYDDADRLATRIGGRKTLFAPCTRAYCEWEKRIDNHTLPRWWRGTGVVFVVSYAVKDGIVDRKGTGYGIGAADIPFYPSSVGLEEQQNWGRTPTPVPVWAGWYTSDLHPFRYFQVKMTPDATPADRRRYTAYNFNCFWRYGGCRDARDLLPAARAEPPLQIVAPACPTPDKPPSS